MQKVTLPALRISSDVLATFKQALKKCNESQMVELSLQDFRRLAYINIANEILTGKPLNAKLKRE
jgi:hypothetical protein